MRITSLLFFAALPFSAFAQKTSVATAPKATRKTEFAFNLGHALDNAYDGFGTGGVLRGSLSLLKNRGHFQYGLTAEAGTNSNDFWYVAPGLVANYRSAAGRNYWYGGAMAGYNLYGDLFGLYAHVRDLRHGYVFGLQAGVVRTLSRRIAFNAEIGVRSSQYWTKYRSDNYLPVYASNPAPSLVVYLPMTIGIRYTL